MTSIPDSGPVDNWYGEQLPPRFDVTSAVELFDRTWWRAATCSVCPICDHDSWCVIRPKEVVCMRDDDGTVVHFGDGAEGWWHPLTPEAEDRGFKCPYMSPDWTWRGSKTPLPVTRISPSKTNTLIASVTERDRVYRSLLFHLNLTRQHRNDLRRRGLSDEAIARYQYASLPRERDDVALTVMRNCGLSTLAGIPGFFQRHRGTRLVWTMGGWSGLLIPYWDSNGCIHFLQLRSDSNGTYYTFSTPPHKYVSGTKALRTAHVAVPKGVDPHTSKRLWITEGALKGGIAAEFLQEPVIALPGVGSWRLLFETCTALLATPRCVVVAFDADKRTNNQVARAEMALIGHLESCGHKVLVAEWDVDAKGAPKGIDDLLVLGLKPREVAPIGQQDATHFEETARDKVGARFRECAAPAWYFQQRIIDPAGGVRIKPVDEAALRTGVHILAVLRNAQPGTGELHLCSDPVGVGKTSVAGKVLKIAHSLGWPQVKNGRCRPRPLKVAVLVDSSREAEGMDIVTKGQKLATEIGEASVSISGRNEKTCGRINEVRALGAAGHDVMRSLCLGCQKQYQRAQRLGDKPPPFIDLKGAWNNVCPYLRQLQAVEDKPVHVMHKATLLNESKKAAGYDVIIVDENLPDALCRTITLDRLDLQTWSDEMEELIHQRMDEMKSNGIYLRASGRTPGEKRDTALRLKQLAELKVALNQNFMLVQLLRDSLLQLKGGTRRVEARPLVEVLKTAANSRKIDAHRLVRLCINGPYKEEKDKGYFPHEKPQRSELTNRHPVRAWRQLLSVLVAEFLRPTGDYCAHVVYDTKSTEQVIGKIELRVMRQELLKTLREKSVVNLDATPNEPLLKALFPIMAATHMPVPENIAVLQVVDNIFGKSAARTALPRRLVRLAAHALSGLAQGSIGVLANRQTLLHLKWIDTEGKRVVGPLCDTTGEPITGGERLVVGYWGRDERATNSYAACDVLIISGLHLPPIDAVEREVQAWRRFLGVERPAQNAHRYIERAYGYADENGLGRSFRCRLHPDPQVDDELVRIWSANLQQAIGRVRGARAKHKKLVVVDTAMPALHVRVDKVCKLREMEEQPAPLKDQSMKAKEERDERLAGLKKLLKPSYDELMAEGKRPSRADLIKAAKRNGITVSDWDARLVLPLLAGE